jgi:hypothetical protein
VATWEEWLAARKALLAREKGAAVRLEPRPDGKPLDPIWRGFGLQPRPLLNAPVIDVEHQAATDDVDEPMERLSG